MGHILILTITIFSVQTWASMNESFLQRFKADPVAAMKEAPPKSRVTPYKFNGNTQTYRQKLIQNNQQYGIADQLQPWAGIEANDQAERLVDVDQLVKSLDTMEEMGLRYAHLAETPWSGDYWAIANGILAARPFDNDFRYADGWKSKKDYVEINSVAKILEQRQTPSPLLSPAEKYDLLIGSEGVLTEKMWLEGQYYYDNHGSVESWMGICHGWAPSAFMNDRPKHSVTFVTADGEHKLKFYPSEIRGLASFMWAEGQYPSRFIGGRCNEKDPELDEEGRLTQPQCFDSNPGTWHQVVVNQIGIAKRSFIMDATFDYEVWNQPVYAYNYEYFNPKTMQPSGDLAGATVTIEDMEDDIFSPHRAEDTKYVVGIQMQVAYIAEVGATMNETDLSGDNIIWVEYAYDLELDADKKIIGGEWYNHAHPDFMWVPVQGARPRTFNDFGFDPHELSFSQSLDSSIQLKAQQNARYGYILPTLVEALIHKSNKGEGTVNEL